MKIVLQNILRFIVLVLVQVLILNNIKFLGFINPYLYILFIIVLPISISRSLLLVLAFALGLCIDIFSNTFGIHAFATVFAAFMREPFIKLLLPRDDNHDIVIPSMHSFGKNQFIKYAVLMVLTHHIVLFVVEAFSFSNITSLGLRTISSSAFTLILLLSIERLKMRK